MSEGFYVGDGLGQSSESDEWYTPESFLKLVYIVLGGELDLDPCGSPHAKVLAKRKYILANGEDGLQLPWYGKWFCNSPYGRAMQKWTAKAAASKGRGREGNDIIGERQGIYLMAARVGTVWFQENVFPHADVCLWKGRMKFDTLTPKKWVAPFDSAVALYSDVPVTRSLFDLVFHQYGKMVMR